MDIEQRLDDIEQTIQAVLAPLSDDARMEAYYYSFKRTGCGPVDKILSAVAVAGAGLLGASTAAASEELIQETAQRSAYQITYLAEANKVLLRALRRALSD